MKKLLKRKCRLAGICLLFIFLGNMSAFSQDRRTVTGTVLNEQNEPLIGVSVVLKSNRSTGTVTDMDGHFSLSVPAGNQTLEVSYLGMKKEEISIKDKTQVKIVMKEEDASLEEVVIVGFGQQKKESVVGAISQAKGEVLERTGGVTSLGAALTGNIPGLVTISNTGMPGEEDPQILIRAQTTWNNSGAPLVLVDGIERPINNVDINSVETISVLKDASATAVFGVRAGNGVILITTKRGQENKAKVEISVNSTMKTISQLPNKYDVYDALMLKNRVVEYELAKVPGQEGVWAYVNPQDFINNYRNQTTQEQRERYPNIDWVDYLFKDFALSYDANINITGGTKFVKYFAAVDYVHEGDLFKEFTTNKGYQSRFAYDRLNTRTNLDFQLTKSTLFKVNLFGSYGVRTSPGGVNPDGIGDYMAGAYNMPGDIFYPQYSDGSWGFYYPERSGVVTQNSARIFANAGVLQRTDTRFSTDFILSQDLSFLLKGLQLKGAISWDNRFRESGRGIRENESVRVKWIDPKTGIEYFDPDQGLNGNTQFDWAQLITWVSQGGNIDNGYTYKGLNYNVQLNYDNTFARRHNVSVMGNFTRQETASGAGIPRYREDWVFRGTYNFASRYFLEFNGAYNGSEQFGTGYRFGFFPSGAVGWLLSSEKFMQNLKFLDMLKLRYSMGKVGDDNIGTGRWLYMDQWRYEGNTKLGIYTGAGETSPYTWYRQTAVGNSEIHWETITKKNFGIDFAFIRNLLSGSVDIYKDIRENILLSGSRRAIPPYYGTTPPTANLGKVEGKGYEITLHVNKKISNGMRLWSNMSMTHSKSMVIDADDPLLKPEYKKTAGFAIGQKYSYLSHGFYNTMDELYASTPFATNDNKIPGSYYIVDFDADGVIDSPDSAPYGYSGSPQNTYNATLGLDWKGFSAFVQFYGVNNVTRDVVLSSFDRAFVNTAYDIGTYWSKENPDADAPLPRLVSQINGNYTGDLYMYDGSYVRLKNAELAYTFTSKWVKKLGANSLRIYLNGNNLWMWTKMPDDRETTSNGVRAYPTVRRFNMGIRITL